MRLIRYGAICMRKISLNWVKHLLHSVCSTCNNVQRFLSSSLLHENTKSRIGLDKFMIKAALYGIFLNGKIESSIVHLLIANFY